MQSAFEGQPAGFGRRIAGDRLAARSARAALARALEGARPVFWLFVASRLALLAIGLMTHIFILPFTAKANGLHLAKHAALNMWGAWDSGWYVSLASAGYQSKVGPEGYVNWVFFPAYPMLSAGLAKLAHMPVFLAMLVVSNLCFLVALLLVRRLARAEFDERTADLTVALLCAVPGSYIFSSAYTESLFLLALTACLLLLRSRRWLAAGAFAALAVLTRNIGMGLVLPFAVLAAPRLWQLGRQVARDAPGARGRFLREALRVAAGLALPVLALTGFAVFLYFKSGDPLAFVTAQKGWGRTFGDPFSRPLIYLLKPRALADNNDLVSFAFVWLSLGLLAALGLMRKWPLFVLATFLALVPLSTGITSYQRYCLVMIPLFMAGAKLLAERPAWATATALTALAALNGFMMVAWSLGLGVTA